MIAPILVFGVGNPSRGDDALGPLALERLETLLADELARGELELATDFQLQIEHALDLHGRRQVVFVDASVDAAPPFAFSRATPRRDSSFSTHAMSPEAVLDTCRASVGEPPEAWVLAIRGERFALGEPLSPEAAARLEAALERLVRAVRGEGARLGRRFEVTGVVQGVGFRPWVVRTARALGLSGAVWNGAEGVTIEASGPHAALEALARALAGEAPSPAAVEVVRWTATAPGDVTGFAVARGEARARADVPGGWLPLPPDRAPCEACLRELRDPRDRHHAYAFTSCATCGPRLAVATALPWDRARTSMAAFPPCAACAAEHDDPEDRRFHAETLACPACGPRVWLADPAGAPDADADPVARAAERLVRGEILAVKGVGAFHLVCDATSDVAVATLRRRKRREQQPFAVMVADVDAARELAVLDADALAALESPARPIVLAPSRGARLAAAVNGASRRTGVLLPYSPLHHRLAALAGRPLVVTSGNASGGPALIDDAEALAELGPRADALLLHDRPIVRRVEDSVVTGARVLRRGRGLAPLSLRLPLRAPQPILALGAHMKTAPCVVVDDRAYVAPHLGDLDTREAERAYARDVEGFERLLGVRAEVIAHDLHPDYATTRYALARAGRRVAVQHHVAHALAALAERGATGPALALVLDGTGFGPDGAAWGAELLRVDGLSWSRCATFRPLALAGGERAIREPWRLALAALVDALGAEAALALAPRLPALAGEPAASLHTVTRMIASGTGVVRAHGMGRWFDAIGALVLGEARAAYDGHVALALEEAAAGEAPPYSAAPAAEVDLRPLVRAVVDDLLAGAPVPRVAARFHATIAEVSAALVRDATEREGVSRVVLGGGCFLNRRLEAALVARLGDLELVTPRALPPGDGGLALGQAWAAVLTLAGDPASSGPPRTILARGSDSS